MNRLILRLRNFLRLQNPLLNPMILRMMILLQILPTAQPSPYQTTNIHPRRGHLVRDVKV